MKSVTEGERLGPGRGVTLQDFVTIPIDPQSPRFSLSLFSLTQLML